MLHHLNVCSNNIIILAQKHISTETFIFALFFLIYNEGSNTLLKATMKIKKVTKSEKNIKETLSFHPFN